MNCVLIAKMDQVLSFKSTGKVGEFCEWRKAETMFTELTIFAVAAEYESSLIQTNFVSFN